MKVTIEGGNIVFTVSYIDNARAKSCGARWHSSSRTWRAKANRVTAAAVKVNFKEDEYDPAIIALSGLTTKIPELTQDPNTVISNTVLRPRQIEAINKAWPNVGFAFHHCMGAGKTITSIALANLRFQHGLIDRLLVICPTSIKGVWKSEVAKWSTLTYDSQVQVLEAGGKVDTWGEFPILVVGVEALSQGGAFDKAMTFVNGGKTMVVIDEASTIKNTSASRTEKCWELGQQAAFRLNLTGTSVTQGIQDLYAQMYFLDPCIIGELSYYSFRNKYCIMGGFEQRKIIGYKDTDILLDRIRPYCDVVVKGDMKLPAKQYQVREVKASPAQVTACKELAREMTTELQGETITVQNALEAMLRFQQIAGGHLPDGTPIATNPKLSELLSLLEDFDGKAIIWARYLPEVARISAELEKVYPGSVISLTGAVSPDGRQALVDDYQSNPQKRFFVVNQATGAKGLTLTAATLTVYFSNTFSLEDRLQSEDRNHRIGQHNEVTYIDLMSDLKVDRAIVTAIANKKDVADYVADNLKNNSFIL